MKTLILSRHAQTDFATYGNIVDAYTSKELCVTLEKPWCNNAHNISCIPAGTYHVHRRMSAKRGYEVFELDGVPDRSNIEIHRGNLPRDSEGCILVGTSFARFPEGHGIGASAEAFERFMNYLAGDHEFTLVVNDPPELAE